MSMTSTEGSTKHSIQTSGLLKHTAAKILVNTIQIIPQRKDK
jgi:hypothetical protein